MATFGPSLTQGRVQQPVRAGVRLLDGRIASTLSCGVQQPATSVEALLKEHECAAVVLEPVVGNSGFIPPTQEFLEGLRAMTTKYGALLVFDEVMTGFRIDYGCAQKHFGVTPDVTTMGKVIGGGLPVGAYGGRRDIMEQVAPAGPMYQAGTLSGNPLAMTAGIKTLEILSRPGQYEKLTKLTERLVEGILREGKAAGHAISGGSISGMFGFFFCEGPVTCFREATASDTDKFARWHRGMLERGVYLAPSQYEAGFMSLAHTEADVDKTIAAAADAIESLVRVPGSLAYGRFPRPGSVRWLVVFSPDPCQEAERVVIVVLPPEAGAWYGAKIAKMPTRAVRYIRKPAVVAVYWSCRSFSARHSFTKRVSRECCPKTLAIGTWAVHAGLSSLRRLSVAKLHASILHHR